ncbi:NTP transferase domain-containing protein, partial [Prochlorococcus sp. AH-716-O10]|nr:NTP transferase domain-containing protein [Prochlorococcus sp. AH-716-O10]
MINDHIALILAAGFGNRMKPLTENNHKTLLKVAGETILGRILKNLEEELITDIFIVTGYRDKQLKEYIKQNFSHLNITFIHNPRYRETNNIYSLALALENIKVDKNLILIESDLIFKKDVLKKLLKSKFSNAALVSKYSTGMDGTVVGISNTYIKAVFPPHLHTEDFDFSDKYKTLNIYKFSSDFCNGDFRKFLTFYSSMIDESCYYELILGIVIYMNRISIAAVDVDVLDWAEVDDPNDLSSAEFLFNLNDRKNILEKSHGGFWNYPVDDYSYIRNFYYPTSSMFSHLRNSIRELIWNYGSSQEIINKKIAYLVGFPNQNIIALSGAAQIYPIIRNIFSGKKVCYPDITFGEYSRIFPKAINYADMFNEGKTLEESIIESDLVIVINPNNPSGKIYSTESIDSFAKRFPEKYFL